MEKMIRSSKLPAFCSGEFADQLLSVMRNQWSDNSQPYPVDIVETRTEKGDVNGYEVIIALAGIPKENIEISVDNDILNISIKKTEREETNTRFYVKSGISRRSVNLRYSLHGVDIGKIVSSFADGMLTVKITLAEESMPRKITIG